jgi:NADH dehydrogenase FAD-containing subunit
LVNAKPNILSEYGSWVSSAVSYKLEKRNIEVINNALAERIEQNWVFLSDGQQLQFDLLLWATGAEPVSLLSNTKFAKDDQGFIRVS